MKEKPESERLMMFADKVNSMASTANNVKVTKSFSFFCCFAFPPSNDNNVVVRYKHSNATTPTVTTTKFRSKKEENKTEIKVNLWNK